MIPQNSSRSRAGRKPIYGEGATLRRKINVRLTEEEHQKLLVLGGTDWLRDRIRSARKKMKLIPSVSRGPKVCRFQARLTDEDSRRFLELGGSRWLRYQLSKTDLGNAIYH